MQDITKRETNTKLTFGARINAPAIINLISSTIGDEARSKRFVASITSAVATNSALKECEFNSILNGALLGEALSLSPSPVLGHFYLVPFKTKDRDGNVYKAAQFQIGYKGFLQLAMRSGNYKKINVVEIKKGELIKYDPLEEEIEVKLIEDDDEREQAETVGYYAFFEYLNGFKKSIYWSKKKMEHHANTYSQGYKARKGYTFWEKNFDEMAKKTMLRQLISKWGIMSLEMEKAFKGDQAVIHNINNDYGDLSVHYIDNDPNVEVVDDSYNHETGEVRDDFGGFNIKEEQPEEPKISRPRRKKVVEETPVETEEQEQPEEQMALPFQ